MVGEGEQLFMFSCPCAFSFVRGLGMFRREGIYGTKRTGPMCLASSTSVRHERSECMHLACFILTKVVTA